MESRTKAGIRLQALGFRNPGLPDFRHRDRHHIMQRRVSFSLAHMSGTYKDLKVWQSAMDMVESVYRLTLLFPREEMYGLTSQLRRASVSVASNIAEGKGRSSDKELLQFLGHAKGSLFEVETQLMIARRLNYLDDSETVKLESQTAEVCRLLNGLMKAFRMRPAA
jgi:four helix bundle protein